MTVRLFISILLLPAVGWGCDTVTPTDESTLVVEGYLNSGRPMPEIEVRRTLSPSSGYDAEAAAVTDAAVYVELDGRIVRYVPDSSRRGTYRTGEDPRPSAGQSYSLRVVWEDQAVHASGTVPPEIEILDVAVSVPDEPVSAVLLDSLALADSLTTGLYTGYIYPIEVQIDWNDASASGWAAEASWIRAQLRPFSTFSSPVVDLFLRSEEILRERDQLSVDGRRTWTGVYAVGVSEADDALPEHRLRVSVIRSGPEYARFAASKDSPDRREPISNLKGAVGVFAAVSVDTTNLSVGPRGTSFLP